jgi:anti-sigma B factor antagonist
VSDSNAATADLAFHGRITVENSGDMRAGLSDALREKPSSLLVDLSDVSYMDTSGVATLVEGDRIARRQGTRLILKGLRDQPRYLFEVTHLDHFFDISAPEEKE